MLPFDQARQIILDRIPSPGIETISVRESLGRVLAEDLTIPRDFPDTHLSAVDGFALRFGVDNHYKQLGTVAAGGQSDISLEPGTCIAVMTGAPTPDGADCVVRVEDCNIEQGVVTVPEQRKPGDLINGISTEAITGAKLAQKGVRITGTVFAALFYSGIPRIKVFIPPRIGMISTGDELREVEEGHVKGQVFNTNRYILEFILASLGLAFQDSISVLDDEVATRQALEHMASKCDIVISSGGVSMGNFDFIKKVFNDPDFSLMIQGTAIKPGRPLRVAEKEKTLFFGMPGYPAAFLTNGMLYVLPALKKATGRIDFKPQLMNVQLTTPMVSRKNRLYLNRAILELKNGQWTAQDPGSQKTSHFLNFAQVNGLVFMPENVGVLETGATAQAIHLDLELK